MNYYSYNTLFWPAPHHCSAFPAELQRCSLPQKCTFSRFSLLFALTSSAALLSFALCSASPRTLPCQTPCLLPALLPFLFTYPSLFPFFSVSPCPISAYYPSLLCFSFPLLADLLLSVYIWITIHIIIRSHKKVNGRDTKKPTQLCVGFLPLWWIIRLSVTIKRADYTIKYKSWEGGLYD